MPNVILVDHDDTQIGTLEKIEAHRTAQLHRAFSVFLLDGGRMLLQQRAAMKYHCPLLWANACCSHPEPGETVIRAATRRLTEELGIEGVPLEEQFVFEYHAAFDNGLHEDEVDHVLTGSYHGMPRYNPEEVESVVWLTFQETLDAIETAPEKFTPWFRQAAPRVIETART